MKKLFENRNVLFISIGFFWIFLGFGGAQQYLVPLLKLQGKEHLGLTSLLILYTTVLIGGIFAPKILHSIGLKKSLLIGAITYLLFSLSVMLNNAFILLAASVLIGFGAILLWQSSGQIIVDSSTNENIGRNLGLQFSLFLFGMLFGTAIGGLLIKVFSLQILYLFFSLTILVSIPFLIKVIPKINNTPDKKFNIYYLFKPKLLLLLPLVFSSYFFSGQSFAAINLIVLNLFGLGFVGIMATIFRISTVTGGLTIGKISDMYQKETILYITTGIGIIGGVLFLSSSSALLVGLGLILLGIFTSTAYPVCLSLLKQVTAETDYKYALGAFHVYANLGIVCAILATRYINLRMSLIIGVVLMLSIFPTIYVFSKGFTKKSF